MRKIPLVKYNKQFCMGSVIKRIIYMEQMLKINSLVFIKLLGSLVPICGNIV